MSALTGVGKAELGVSYLVVRTKGDQVQKWADVVLEASAQEIADRGNAREDGWTYTVRRSRTP